MRVPDLLVRARRLMCAVPLNHVGETLRPLPIEPTAGAPPFVLGLAVIRGAPVPVVDLGAILHAEGDAAPARFVTLRIDRRRVALAVEDVVGVRDMDPSDRTAPPPLLREALPEAVEAIASLDAGLLLVLSAARLAPEDIAAPPPDREATP